jgi:hypothetical protein
VGLPTNSLNKIFMRLYEDIDDKTKYLESVAESLVRKKSSQRFPKDAEVIAALKEKDVYGIQSRNRTYLFERLENFQNKEPVKIENNPDITIEHIFPQTPDPKWKIQLDGGEYKQLAENYLNTVANLTLSGNNSSLGNRTFTEKRELPDKGYKDSRLYLNQYLGKIDRWGIEQLNERFNLLSERFLEIWPYPQVTVKPDIVEYPEANIFDIDDPTGKKLKYAIFLDEKLKLRSVTDLYSFVFETLFELEPERFFVADLLAEKVQITKDAKDLRNAKAISDTYYIETHLNNEKKFERIKYALNVFDLADELLVKLTG